MSRPRQNQVDVEPDENNQQLMDQVWHFNSYFVLSHPSLGQGSLVGEIGRLTA